MKQPRLSVLQIAAIDWGTTIVLACAFIAATSAFGYLFVNLAKSCF